MATSCPRGACSWRGANAWRAARASPSRATRASATSARRSTIAITCRPNARAAGARSPARLVRAPSRAEARHAALECVERKAARAIGLATRVICSDLRRARNGRTGAAHTLALRRQSPARYGCEMCLPRNCAGSATRKARAARAFHRVIYRQATKNQQRECSGLADARSACRPERSHWHEPHGICNDTPRG